MDLQALKTSASAPASATSSPGLYSPSASSSSRQFQGWDNGTPAGSPYLHPLQMHKVRETHKAAIEQDFITGRKVINQYEILGEIGRGMHGKVKLARNLETNDKVAIKIIQRYSKKRRLGRVTVSPEAKTKREIAILKKIRHPNVVGLYEVIDDPELKKIYMILEYVELGEIIWRKKGAPQICAFERRRIEREMRGEKDVGDEERFFKMLERRRKRKEAKRAKLTQQAMQSGEYWSLEHGDDEDDDDFDETPLSRTSTQESLFMPRSFASHLSHASYTSLRRSNHGSRSVSRATSRAPSRSSSTAQRTPLPTDFAIGPNDSDQEDEAPGPLPTIGSTHSSAAGLLAQLNAHASADDPTNRGRSPSTADSIISHMSSVDDFIQRDTFEDDFSYVPCFTMEQARSTFRDTVLGLEYLHYEGIVHRDIKPANLLWTNQHRVKISDFGVSYFGRPIRDGENEDISESDAQDFDDDLELSKTVGTPAFFAPELCYTDLDGPQPKINDQIDVWSLGVTLYCLIFARIPFLAEDEYQLFKAIAQQDVYIPRRRLKAVNPGTPLPGESIPENVYRDDDDLVMEDIDDELYDLLRRMLIKNPAERIKLREVKRHPWVLRGIDNVIGWLDDTDPSRKTAGKRIQVDDRELERAVVPITFLERARSAVKKAVGKVIGRGEGSRKRAISSATSSGNDSVQKSPLTVARDSRRASLRGDESYFGHISDHPLSQSVTASPQLGPLKDSEINRIPTRPLSIGPQAEPPHLTLAQRPPPPERSISTTGSIRTLVPQRTSHNKSPMDSPKNEEFVGKRYSPDIMATFTDHFGGAFRDSVRLKNTRSMDLKREASEGSTSRAKSADRLLSSGDKHAEPSTAVSKAVAPGSLEQPKHIISHTYSRSTDSSPIFADHLYQNQSFRPPLLHAYHTSISSPNVFRPMHVASMLDDRPTTANRIPELQGSTSPHLWQQPVPNSVQQTPEEVPDNQSVKQESQQKIVDIVEGQSDERLEQAEDIPEDQIDKHSEADLRSHLPSLDAEDVSSTQNKDDDTMRAKSSSSITSFGVISPSTFASNLTSPISSTTLGSSRLGSSSQEQCFPSDPSLPALVSGGSSVSAGHEGDAISHASYHSIADTETPETLTPPALTKFVSHDDSQVPAILDLSDATESELNEDDGYIGDADNDIRPSRDRDDENDDDSDSDEGLTMGSRKTKSSVHGPILEKRTLERRNTNISVGSTETAKKVGLSD